MAANRDDRVVRFQACFVLSALAGYNPMAAVSLWRKMDAQSESQPPEFLSTHPSNENRIEDLQIEAKKYEKLYKENKNSKIKTLN